MSQCYACLQAAGQALRSLYARSALAVPPCLEAGPEIASLAWIYNSAARIALAGGGWNAQRSRNLCFAQLRCAAGRCAGQAPAIRQPRALQLQCGRGLSAHDRAEMARSGDDPSRRAVEHAERRDDQAARAL